MCVHGEMWEIWLMFEGRDSSYSKSFRWLIFLCCKFEGGEKGKLRVCLIFWNLENGESCSTFPILIFKWEGMYVWQSLWFFLHWRPSSKSDFLWLEESQSLMMERRKVHFTFLSFFPFFFPLVGFLWISMILYEVWDWLESDQ